MCKISDLIEFRGEINRCKYKTDSSKLTPTHSHTLYLLAVLQDALLGADAALGARGVRLPFATLHIDVHVELPAEHGHLGLS